MVLDQVFGKASAPVLRCRRIAYWLKRFHNTNPFQHRGDLILGASRMEVRNCYILLYLCYFSTVTFIL